MKKSKKIIIASLALVIVSVPTQFNAQGIESGVNSAVSEAQGLAVPLATLGLVVGGIMGIWGSFFGDGIGPHAKKIITGIGIGLALIGSAATLASMAGGWFGL